MNVSAITKAASMGKAPGFLLSFSQQSYGLFIPIGPPERKS